MILAASSTAEVLNFPERAAVLEPQPGLSHKNKFSPKLDRSLTDVMTEMKIGLPDLRVILNTNVGEMFIQDNHLPTRCVAQWRVLTRIWYGPDDINRRKMKRLVFSKEYHIVAMILTLLVKFPRNNVASIVESFHLI